MSFSRESILAKVKALLSKTVENGCTEAEAMSALDKARSMMDANDISDTDLAFGGETVTQSRVKRDDPDGIRWNLGMAGAVAGFCDCKCWGEEAQTSKIVFLGLDSDTVFAGWLLDTLEAFVKRQSLQFLADMGRAIGGETDLFGAPLSGKDREHKRRSFITGCAIRIAERLREATAERKRASVAGTGRSMVVVKNALVDDAFQKLNLNLKRAKAGRVGGLDGTAYARGQSAGNRASLGRPVNGRGGPALRIS